MGVEKEFGVDKELETLYRNYLALIVLGCFLWWIVPFSAYLYLQDAWIGVIVALVFFTPLLVATVFVLVWIPRLCSSISYVLTDEEVVVTKGVWWKTKSIVPYNRITNINTYQGPLSRSLGLGRLAIQTAGFSGASSSRVQASEAEIVGRRDFEEIKNVVLRLAKGRRPVAVEAEKEVKLSGEVDELILKELRGIRKVLEK